MPSDFSHKWKYDGVRVVRADGLDIHTPQTPGMNRAAAITNARAGAEKLWAVPPYVPHQEINASDDQPLSCVLVRSGQVPVVVNLDIPAVEKPEEIHWVDNIHPAPE